MCNFFQCQSQLKRLYREGNNGCYFEFSAYNLLCVMLHSNNKRDLLSSMARYHFVNSTIATYLVHKWTKFDIYIIFSLSKEAKQDGAVKHALAVHAAVSSGNYVIFFKLYKQGPNLNSCLMGKGNLPPSKLIQCTSVSVRGFDVCSSLLQQIYMWRGCVSRL